MRYSCNWVGKGGSWHSVMATCSLAGGLGGQFVHPWRPSLLKVLLPTPRVVANLWDLGFWNTFWEHYTCSHGPFAAECWAFTKWRWESVAASLPTLLVKLPGFLLLFFFLQYFIEHFSLQVATMPGSAEPGPAAVGSTEISVIYLPVLTAIARLHCTKWKGCQVFFTSCSAVLKFCGLAWIWGPDLGCIYRKLHTSPMYALCMICSLSSIGCMLLTCICKCIPTERHKGVCIAQGSSGESWVALRHAAFGEHRSTSHHRGKQLLWPVQTEMLSIDSPVFTLLQSNLIMPCSFILFHISAMPPQFPPHPILQS